MERWAEKEIKKIDLQIKGLRDPYNTLEDRVSVHDVEKVLHTTLKYAPCVKQKLSSYLIQLQVHLRYAEDVSFASHVNGAKGAWFTHRRSKDCFMCQDLNIMNTMFSVLDLISKRYPDITF